MEAWTEIVDCSFCLVSGFSAVLEEASNGPDRCNKSFQGFEKVLIEELCIS